jgi:hypothetical protein
LIGTPSATHGKLNKKMTNLTRVSNNSPKLIIGEIKQILVEVREHPQFHPKPRE